MPLNGRLTGRCSATGLGKRSWTRMMRIFAVPALLILVHAAAHLAPAPGARAVQPPTAGGMLAMLSAQAGSTSPTQDDGLTIAITLENGTGADVHGLLVRAPIPAGARLSQSWMATPGQGAGTMEADAVVWGPLSLRIGERGATLGLSVVPAPGEDGARIFRTATFQPALSWTEPSGGRATPGALRLNGLWGEEGLRRTLLPSGLTVFTREQPQSATVAIQLAVRAGSRDEDEVTRGGSHWLEHAFFLGTPRRAGNEEIFNAIRAVGGQINASTSFAWTNYYNTVPAEQFDLGLDVLADQILNSTFPRDRFDRERRVVAEEIRRAQDNPASRASREFFQLVFQQSPIRQDVLGSVQSVADIPIDTILAYRAQRYVTGNIAVAAAGNLRHDQAVAAVAAAFAALPQGSRAERPRVVEPIQTAPRRLVLGDGARLAEIRLGWPVPGDDDEDSAALEILEDILGPTGRRLQEEIRDRRALASAVGPSYAVFADTGAFYIGATTQVERVDAVTEAILAQIERIRAGDLGEEEVQAAVRARVGRRALSGETSLGRTNLATIEVSGELDSFLEFQARLQPVSAADVIRAARTYLDPENHTIVVVRP